jgi:hypothetical protein
MVAVFAPPKVVADAVIVATGFRLSNVYVCGVVAALTLVNALPATSATVADASSKRPTTPLRSERLPPETVTSYVPVDPLSMAIRETVAVDPEIAKSSGNNPLTASVKINLKVNASKPVVSDDGANREILVSVGAVVSMSTEAEFENPDVPVFTPVTTARALKVCVPAEMFDDGENAYAPPLSATVEPSGVELPSK